jgi:hypothetical protein
MARERERSLRREVGDKEWVRTHLDHELSSNGDIKAEELKMPPGGGVNSEIQSIGERGKWLHGESIQVHKLLTLLIEWLKSDREGKGKRRVEVGQMDRGRC